MVKGNYWDSSFFTITIDAEMDQEFFLKIVVPNYADTSLAFRVTGDTVRVGEVRPMRYVAVDGVSVVYSIPTFTRTMDGIKE